jgi:hypothetical protein
MKRLIFSTLLVIFLSFLSEAKAQSPKEEIKTLLVERDQEVKTLLGTNGSEYSD